MRRRLELRGVDVAHARVDAGELEVARIGERHTLLVAGGGENFEAERASAGTMRQARALERVAGLFE